MRPIRATGLTPIVLTVGWLFAASFGPGCSCKNDETANGVDLSAPTDDLSIDTDGSTDMTVNLDQFPDLLEPAIPADAFGPDGQVVVIVDDGGNTVFICHITACGGKVYKCGDCMDNDGDNLIDSQDPDCLGPCQNNEAGFEGNIPGQNNAPCKMDCYWDKDSGGGGDACYWSHKCDPFEEGGTRDGITFAAQTAPELDCKYDANAQVPGATVPNGQKDCVYLKDNQTQQCTDYCAPLTPNGCDCFGCCENPLSPGNFVYAGSVNAAGQGTCSAKADDLNDPTRCKPCTPVAGNCYKQCDRCELCFGKTTVPADCVATMMPDMFGQTPPDMTGQPPPDLFGVTFDLTPPPLQCPIDQQPCGLPGQDPCGTSGYCISGCCVYTIP